MKSVVDLMDRVRQAHEALAQLPGVTSEKPLEKDLNGFVEDPELLDLIRPLFVHGHYPRAVEEAFKFLNKLVKTTAGAGVEKDGATLMQFVFSPTSPVLRINSMANQSERDEQIGYMQILAGSMTGIRNPRAHEPSWHDDELRALQLLALADHLVKRVRASTKV